MMNDISKAIAFFETVIHEGEKICEDCSPEQAAKLAEQRKHYVVANNAMRLILSDPKSALRLIRKKK